MRPYQPKKIAILGSTGSIGRQALEVIRSHPEAFSVDILSAHNNADLLIEQAGYFCPATVLIGNPQHHHKIQHALSDKPIQVVSGNEKLEEVVAASDSDTLLMAMVGISGLQAIASAIQCNKNIAIANKEMLVSAGHILIPMARRQGVHMIPVDSEHSAIFQCLRGEQYDTIEKIWLTASGGPFRGMSQQQLSSVSKKEALNHPNWSMGEKVTIDSATMMNKGLEMIVAGWLFNLSAGQINIITHPQSIVHSMVQFVDGSIKAQMGFPDMKFPIQYAMAYPDRIPAASPPIEPENLSRLDFDKTDMHGHQCLKIALHAMKAGKDRPCVMNAANEAAVTAFLSDQLRFVQIPEVIEESMKQIPEKELSGLEDVAESHQKTLNVANTIIKTIVHDERSL